jgi:hypothetical protein
MTVTDAGKQTLFRQSGRFFKRPSDLQASLFDFLAASRGKSGAPAIITAYMPSYGGCEVTADIDILGIKPELRAAKTLEVAIERLVEPHRQRMVAGTSYRMAYHREPIPASGLVTLFIRTPPLPLGSYGVFCRLLNEKGKVLFEKVDTFKRHHFEWENNTLGKGDVVIPPWTPMTVQKQTVGVWGRNITFGADGLPASVKSQGEELLAKPIRLDASIGGKNAAWKTEESFKVTKSEPGVVETVAKGKLGELPVTIETRTEYDGLTKVTLSLRPSGKTDLQSMDLVIPMAEPVDTTIINGCGGRNPDFFGELPKGEGVLWQAYKNLPNTAGIKGKYISLCYLGNGERGLSYICWSDQGWILDDSKDTAEIRRVNGVVELVLHLANTPRTIDAPRQIQFALQATPVKPMTPGYRRDVNPLSKINDVEKKPLDVGGIPAGFLSCYGGAPGTDQITMQDETDWAIFRELVLRQKRNDWPKYDRKILRYTATNTLGLGMREYETYAGEWAFSTELKPNPAVAMGFRGEFGLFDSKQQTRVRCDLLPSSVDMRVWAFDQLQKKAGLNGFWWDHESYWSSASVRRGTAYVRDDGQVQGTLNIPLFHEMFKRMATVSHQNAMPYVQGRYPHSGNIPAINGFCSYLWATEGFWYMPNLSFDQYENVGGLAGYRALIGRWLGVPVLHRAVVQDRDFKLDKGERPFQSRSIIGLALLHDIGIESHGLHPALVKKTATLLDTFDLFDDTRTEWIPYWRSAALAKPDTADTVATVYINHPKKGPVEALVVVFNTRKEPAQATVALDGAKLLGRPIRECLDLETGKALEARLDDGKAVVKVPLESHDYRLVLVK